MRVREAKKKFLGDSPPRGERPGGGKGLSTKEKRTFLFFLYLQPILFKTTYPNINISIIVLCIIGRKTHSLNRFLEIFAKKNMDLLVEKLREKYVKIHFRLFYGEKKVLLSTKPMKGIGEGARGLSGNSPKKTFLRLPQGDQKNNS